MIREISSVPVIILTVRSSEEDKVRGLDLGADDYITKPFSPRELVSRLRAVLRRVQPVSSTGVSVLVLDDRLSLDFNTGEVLVEGERIKLRPIEFRLLRHLIENAGWTVPWHAAFKVWGYEYKDAVSIYVSSIICGRRLSLIQRTRVTSSQNGNGLSFRRFPSSTHRKMSVAA